MSRLHVIQVGTYPMVHSAHLANAMRELPDIYTLDGIIEDDPILLNSARSMQEYKDLPFLTWEDALRKHPDAFMIETEEHQLVPCAIRALLEGYPVYMDKPGSEDASQFRQMCELAKHKQLPLSIGYMFRENPAILYAKRLIEDGCLGEILSVEAQMSCSCGTDYREKLRRFRGGMMYYLGCHLIDLIYSFCGEPDEIVPLNACSMEDNIDCVDIGFCVYRYAHGVSFAKSSATEINGASRRSVIISGTKGTFEINPIEKARGNNWDDVYGFETLSNDHPWNDKKVPVTFEPFGRYDGLLLHFAQYVRGEKKNPFSYEYEERLHDIILASCALPTSSRKKN